MHGFSEYHAHTSLMLRSRVTIDRITSTSVHCLMCMSRLTTSRSDFDCCLTLIFLLFLLRRKRSPDKMQRNRDLTAARRQEENSMIAEFTDVLPLSKEELKKADRTALIRLALHFIKMKTIPGLSQSSGEFNTWQSRISSF